MTTEASPTIFISDENELQKDIIKAYIVKEWDEWSPLYNRVLRAAGLDSGLSTKFLPHQKTMDKLLDELIEVPGVLYE